MADETDAEKIARLEQECEELTEELKIAQIGYRNTRSTLNGIRMKMLGMMGDMRAVTDA